MGLNYDISGEQGITQNLEDVIAPFVNALSSFRDKIRKFAFQKDIEGVLKTSDEVRNDVLPFLGIKLEDKGQEQPAQWKYIPKEILIQEREIAIEEKKKKDEQKQKILEQKKQKEFAILEQSKVPPESLFINETDKYSKFDEIGLPTHDKDGKPISESQRKKLKKLWEKQDKLHKKFLGKTTEEEKVEISEKTEADEKDQKKE